MLEENVNHPYAKCGQPWILHMGVAKSCPDPDKLFVSLGTTYVPAIVEPPIDHPKRYEDIPKS
jgi:hypothetical protein